MYLIIGIYKEDKRIKALKLYDTVTKEMGLYHKDQVFKACNRFNIQIGGITDKYNIYGKSKKVLSKYMYNTYMLDIVDADGHPINGVHTKIPVSVKGYDESMIVTLVDSTGAIEKVDYNKLLELLEAKEVIGIRKAKYITFHRWCEKQGIKCKQCSKEQVK